MHSRILRNSSEKRCDEDFVLIRSYYFPEISLESKLHNAASNLIYPSNESALHTLERSVHRRHETGDGVLSRFQLAERLCCTKWAQNWTPRADNAEITAL